ncbi:hypothetical protein OIU77_017011 [Salix suchowensis]|uniref:ubiquitinyl hydrolase 1 n=4 Tax=Salix TaxID=40685 RepID=A0A9Q1ANF5_9ROSI|nr:hypothetical protein DKX38_024702 [Salix brachista]KAG5253797.1 josephin protein [Salix suchowensis]KAJ6755278.1 JOSEPHIN-LIKE PROTEIN [Salix purpurea]KAJ6777703.1 JOSEPHIN-LIKE PROTEIN [Salix koriyanagi]KAJ6303045.1 hypothetical protein OIU77_017011 [Salix suchowensis]
MDSKKTGVYHEKQKLQFCLLHALNNLFQQQEAFTRARLNEISGKLVLEDPSKKTWTPFSIVFKPHHNAFTGNYDINVLIAALEEKDKTVVWHDRRNAASTIDLDGADDSLFGIVLNVPARRYALLWKGRHWITMRKIGGVWYNLDSDLPKPMPFESTREVRGFLDYVLSNGGEVLLVMNQKE